ncbi:MULTISPECIES: LysR family transcriptional regulator [Thermomonospora]|uniref:Transcriptional regulator, LysR family n=1 Tax=Thermomonospora curvata (strain ATCC 19995 / DSM 43183 / JCM 3096 / KCTC 9072 / NBRC 15933 / NCIMB 10081 / Henssen B9) TaxID=471852 RepID=D1A510_THECD|nr:MULTISPECIES: LysR family transcriptional regulator [Thermomonospora]ACY98179.1 transcriptional regulator, LysR family [Thermomonospora curvata DSM 43183]PKK13951.1 MAG: LysR family transcriptional regulator [Thermomonospora sp. CIF 1]
MNLRQLRYVVATADHGTMTSAAAALYVAQPALSRAVRELERELGVELFARSGRGVVLTPVGEQVVHHARIALAAVEAIEALAVTRPDGRGAELRVATTAALEAELTGRLLPRFARDQPAVRVRVVRCGGREALTSVVRTGRAEVALTDLPVPSDLAVHPLEHRELVLVSPPGLKVREPLAPAALDGMRLVLPARGGPHRAGLDALLARIGVTPVPAVETDDQDSWLEQVRQGAGSLLWYRGRLEDTQGLVVRSFTPPLSRTIGLVHAHRRLPPVVRDFLAFAKEDARERRGEGRVREHL